MRNEQLQTLEKDFYAHEKSRQHDNVVVVGDFNITPWSVYYK
jgi:endonuclease/exonuclease/phosphatase (EEP) superfamily protein YafD